MENRTKLSMMTTLAAFAEVDNTMGRRRKNVDELHGVDISKEYELIQKKKSKLSARLRRVVEYRYSMGMSEKANDGQ